MESKTYEPIEQGQEKKRTSSPERKISPTRTSSPKRGESPTRTGSPRRGESPTRTGSPKRGESPTRRERSPSPSKYRLVDIRQNFSQEVETEINEFVHMLMIGGYQFLSMATYFDRDDVALFGMAHFAK